MAKNNDDFFDVKKDWSKIKDSLLDGYLPEYFSKVFWTNKTIVYVDCFSGMGKFKSGEDGSPRMALKRGLESITKSSDTSVTATNRFVTFCVSGRMKAAR